MAGKGYSVYQRSSRSAKRKRETTYTVCVYGAAPGGKNIYIRGVANREVAHEIGRSHVVQLHRVRGGVITRQEATAMESAKSPFSKHLTAWEKSMKDRRTKPTHYEAQVARVKAVARLAKLATLPDLAPERVQSALARVADDTSPQTARHYYGAVRAFVYWCVETGRLATDPLAALKRPNADGEVFKRTPFPPEKLADLIDTARTRATRAKHSGEDRAMFYATLAYTGLRKAEAMSLTPESFKLAEGSIVVQAGYTKNGEEATLPLRDDVAELFRPWLAGKKPGRKVFAFGTRWDCEDLFRQDCAAVGIMPAEDERLGVHSLRRMFITSAIRSGGLAVAQDLARHSTPTLTKRYADLNMKDYEKGLAGLPPVAKPAEKPAQKREQA